MVGVLSIEESSRLGEITSSEIESRVRDDEVCDEGSANGLGNHSSDEVLPYELDWEDDDCV